MLAFTDVTAGAGDGVADLGHSRVAHFVDLDRDGHRDLVILNDDDGSDVPPSRILRGDGGGSFIDVTADSGFRPIGYLHAGLAVADYDRDGLLDLYVTVWTKRFDFPGWNRLYRNLGNLHFEDVTEQTGIGILERDSFTTIFTDFDGDTWPDFYTAVDHRIDFYFRNTGGAFVDDSARVGIPPAGNDMGVAAADFDRDDDLDLYLTNITDPSGHFGTGPEPHNRFLINQQGGPVVPSFVEESVQHGVEDTYWGWGTEWGDVDNDGDLDLAAVSGFDEWV